MDDRTYRAERGQIDAWVSQQLELGELRVVRPYGAYCLTNANQEVMGATSS